MKVLLKVLFGLFILSLAGCVATWVRPPGVTEHQFKYDLAQCQAVANGAVPMQAMPQQPSTVYHRGTVTSSGGGYATYSGTSTPAPNYNALAVSIGNLGASIRQREITESCLITKGYTKADARAQASYELRHDKADAAWRSGGSSDVRTLDIPSAIDGSARNYIPKTVYVLRWDADLRSIPSLDGDALIKVQKNDEVIASEESDSWLKVRKNGIEGWVHKSWVISQ